MNKRRLLLLGSVLFALALFYGTGGAHYFSLEFLQAHQTRLLDWTQSHTASAALLYCTAYIALTALAFPGAWTLSLLGGYLFGFWWGSLWVTLSATIGAVVSFLSARFLFRDYLQSRFRDKIGAFNKGIEQEGAFYLLALRLNPIVPFVLINLGMGLTPMTLWTYTWVTVVSILPGMFLYVNAGLQIAKLRSASDILSPSFIGASILLGVFPLVMKWILKKRAP